MALTVRPDDEVYQFDTVWLGPDEYTLPIQARYVAWGTWLSCFLISAAVLIPLGGNGAGGVIGSTLWAVAVSVVASRAIMLVVDHERPLRSLPAMFNAEARAALAASRRGERSMLVRPAQVRVRELPEKARALRDRRRAAEQRRTAKSNRRRGLPDGVTPATRVRPGTLAASRPEVLAPSTYHPFQSYQTYEPIPAERWEPAPYQQSAYQQSAYQQSPYEQARYEQVQHEPAAYYQSEPAGPGQPPAEHPTVQPADGRRSIEERILYPVVRKAR
jgi:hypothetical protein